MTLTRIAMPSPNYSGRNPAGARLIVLHTAEGARTIESLGNFFANPANDVSSHAGIDDTANTIGVYVRRQDCAWTQAGANAESVSAELCAFAAWDSAEWHRHPNMLANCAAWLAEEAAAFGIPLVKLSASYAQGAGRGVCQHVDLGSWGGGHVDCGPAFPVDEVIAMAAGQPGPTPPPERKKTTTMFVAYATSDSSNNPNVKKGFQFIIKESGVASMANTTDSETLQELLGPAKPLSGNQIAAFM